MGRRLADFAWRFVVKTTQFLEDGAHNINFNIKMSLRLHEGRFFKFLKQM